MILTVLVFNTVEARAQAKNEKTKFSDLINSRDFIFKAQTVLPLSGSFRNLTSEYDVVVSPDSVNANLPYFGRAYTAPIGESSGGINFISTNYEYNVKPWKKGSWQITIVPK
ncbi:MAG TPA: DUF4251 domain-containing protein, partial [Flavisolibacter sp.]|nr:DUF4251 domain-containing protein [Flavisolibacter sp.]